MTPTVPGDAGHDVLSVPAVLRGAGVGVVICLPLAVAGQALADGDGDVSLVAVPLYLGVLLGLAAAGWVAARAAATAPYTNGGLAALGAFVAIQGTALAVRAVIGDGDDGPAVAAVAFNALLAYGCGLAGGAVASRRRGGRA